MNCLSRRFLAGSIAVLLGGGIRATAQLPFINTGVNSQFSQIDMAEIYLDTMHRQDKPTAQRRAQDTELVDSGIVSALDLAAPPRAIDEFNRANTLLKAQKSKEAITHLKRAIEVYPKFVSAHVGLGLACSDVGKSDCAKSEFETAAKMDDKFPGSFVHLGQLALSQNDFGTAQTAFVQASRLSPKDAKILSGLAYAQNGLHEYRHALETATRVHALDHKGMASVHYVAASAAMALNDFDTMERELGFFVDEDPGSTFAPTARQNLAALNHNRAVRAAPVNHPSQMATVTTAIAGPDVAQTFPNTSRLKAELAALGDEMGGEACEDCNTLAEADPAPLISNGGAAVAEKPISPPLASGAWTIRKSVDQVALFLAVSHHGHTINDLKATDVQILDDKKPPEAVVQFTPQSKLPLRLALLVDTSGSVKDRFSFEKHAAAKFAEKMLSGPSDLAFVSGFSHETTVTQDFTSEPGELGKGIEKLANGGGTAVFDAISFACWKLAAYPGSAQAAKVLVILSDGEDNSSHSSLKQSIEIAERTGVTIYTVSTRPRIGDKSDADKILEQLAERSGGEALFPSDLHNLAGSLDKLHEVIRSRYFIAYKPADFQPDGSYRSITVIAKKDGKRLQVRARAGYHARFGN